MPSVRNIGDRHPFVKTMAGALRDRCGIEPGSPLLLAVSGGADSVAMLRAMALLAPRPKWRLNLTVGHVHHGLRDDAEGDAQFVEALAKSLELPFLRRNLSLNFDRGNLEDVARIARYDALLEMAEEADADSIVTAHHGDDQLETLLMRLMRGSSVSGLRGIAWRRSSIGHAAVVRPLLGLDRDHIVAYLDILKQPWREDHTNQDRSKTRAKLRADVLPHLHALNPDVMQRVVALTDHFGEVAELIDVTTTDAMRLVDRSGPDILSVQREHARALPAVILTELLRRLCMELGVGGDALGHRTLQPIARMIRDREGGYRVVELQRPIVVEVTADDVLVKKQPHF